jgi:alkanesulfonate monooxygenase SsuD/methylene tetrahydromethanopterin reductase-like flavin-dependent oxidoreductase (luciferase family)
MKFGFYSQMTDAPVTRVYADLLEELKEQVIYCEQAGFDIAWADEHHFNFRSVNSPNPIVAGAMLAAHTSRIRIGLPVPLPNWHPLRLAEDVALLDHLSRGRVELDMGRGISPFDVANLNPHLTGVWPDPRVRFQKSTQTASREHYAEVLEILKKAWTEEYFSHKGRYYEFPQPGFTDGSSIIPPDSTALKDGEIVKMSVDPKPYQKPYPTLRMLMTSEPSFQEGAELGLKGWVWVQPPQRLRQRLEVYAGIRSEQEGRQFRIGEDVGALRMVYVAPSYEEAKRDTDAFFTPIMKYVCSNRPQDYYLDEGGKMPANGELDWEFFRKQLLILAGTPEQVKEQIHELGETCGLDFIGVWMEAGGMSHQKIMSSLDLFADKVAPQFAGNGA